MRKILFAILIFSVTNAHARTSGTLTRLTRYLIIDSTIAYNSPRWTDADILEQLNIAQERIARETLCCYKGALISPVTGQIYYDKPTDVITFDRVSFLLNQSTNSYKKLVCFTLPNKDRDTRNTSWMYVSSGIPTNYFEYGNKYGLFPPVGRAYAWPNALKIEYFYRPPVMTGTDAIPFDGIYELYDYHFLIAKLAAISLMEAEGRDTSIATEKYRLVLKSMKEKVKYKPDYQGNMQYNAHQ